MAAKYKRLTNKEKQFNKKIRNRMIESGLIKTKPRLNRKKFLKDTEKEYSENILTYADSRYIFEAIAFMTPSEGFKIDSEGVGIIKLMKMAVEIKKFHEDKRKKGEDTYRISELYDVIKPIKEM